MMKKMICLLMFVPSLLWAQRNSEAPDSIGGYMEPKGWFTNNDVALEKSGILSVKRCEGFYNAGVRISNRKAGDGQVDIGYLSNSPGNIFSSAAGGFPYDQHATAITGFYRYHLIEKDTALLFVIFKKNGKIISGDVFKIRGTGNQDMMVSFSYPLSLNETPDSVIIAISAGDLYHKNVAQAGSFIEIDQLALTGNGKMKSLPFGAFDDWYWLPYSSFSSYGLQTGVITPSK